MTHSRFQEAQSRVRYIRYTTTSEFMEATAELMDELIQEVNDLSGEMEKIAKVVGCEEEFLPNSLAGQVEGIFTRLKEKASEEETARLKAVILDKFVDQVKGYNDLVTQIHRLEAAVLNQCGDNLCWMTDADIGKVLPEAEHLESCRRYRNQIASERGELPPGCMTIAQLEADNEKLRKDLKAAHRKHLHEILAEQQICQDLVEQLTEFKAPDPDSSICTFCNKKGDAVGRLIQAPQSNIFICEECIGVCGALLGEHAGDGATL